MTVETNVTVDLSSAYYDPQTQTTTSQIPITPSAQTFHVEVGYDTSGNLVLNAWPTGSTATDSGVSVIRFANALASAINAGSLVSASVSGSTVYLTARENGVNTNYSLVTSYSYNTSEFTSPAFTASASGSAMTGGTN